MAARRLIIVMLVLLGVSTAVAIIAPDPAERAAESGATGSTSTEEEADGGSTGPTGPTGQTGGTTGSKGPAEGKDGTDAGQVAGTIEDTVTLSRSRKGASVCARPGSRLVLTVKAAEPLDVTIPNFGRTATITPYAPELVDLLMPEEPGRYDIETLQTGRALATIVSDDNCELPGGTASN